MMLLLECGVESVHFLLKDGKTTDKVSFLEVLVSLNCKSGADLCQSLGPACASGGWSYHTADRPNPVVSRTDPGCPIILGYTRARHHNLLNSVHK